MDYKKYSLENLENWLYDAMSAGEATPQEIYDVIVKVVKDEYYTYKKRASESYELLALLNGNGKGNIKEFDDCVDKILSCDRDDPSSECKSAWNDFWEDCMPPWGHSDMEALRYSEEELNAMCDKAASDDEKNQCREYNLREAEYYNKRAQLDIEAAGGYEWTPLPPVEGKKSKYYYEYDRNDPNRENPFKDRVVKWVLPVQQVKNWVFPPGTKPGSDVDYILEEDYVVNLPDDLLEAANLKVGDTVEWVDNGDGSYLLKKV